MSLTKHQVNVLVGYLIAWYHETRRPLPKGLAPYSGTVGTVKRKMIVVYQKAHGMKVDGTFNTATQKALTPVDPRVKKAAAVVAYCQWAIGHHSSFVYSQERPVTRPPTSELYALPKGGRYRDCSAFAEDAEYVGFRKSVNGYTFASGYGNTDSMLKALPHVPIAKLRQADLVVFSNPGHVIVVTAPHATDPAGARWAASNGHQGAPEYVSLTQELLSHHGAYTGLAVD